MGGVTFFFGNKYSDFDLAIERDVWLRLKILQYSEVSSNVEAFLNSSKTNTRNTMYQIDYGYIKYVKIATYSIYYCLHQKFAWIHKNIIKCIVMCIHEFWKIFKHS